MSPPQPPDAAARAALQQLADIVSPPPVSSMPQTWAWAVVALAVLALVAYLAWRWHRHREANRYRDEALALLTAFEHQAADPEVRRVALSSVGALLKRTALAVFPRSEVARLSGDSWVAFLGQHVRGPVPGALGRLLNDGEYHQATSLDAISPEEAKAVFAAARQWIRRHRVPA